MNRKKKSPNKISSSTPSCTGYECRTNYIVEMERIINKSAFLMKIYDENHGAVPALLHNNELDNCEKIQLLNAKLSAKLPNLKNTRSNTSKKKDYKDNNKKGEPAKRMQATPNSTLEGYSELNSENENKKEEESQKINKDKDETKEQEDEQMKIENNQVHQIVEKTQEEEEEEEKEEIIKDESTEKNLKEEINPENETNQDEKNNNQNNNAKNTEFVSFCDSISIQDDQKKSDIGIQTNSNDFHEIHPLKITVKTGNNNFKNAIKKGNNKKSTKKHIYLGLNNNEKMLLNNLKIVDKKSNKNSNLLFDDESVHSFLLDSSIPIDDIKTISVMLESKALWFLESISIMDTSTKAELLFPCRRWIGRNSSDGLSEIKLGYTPPLIQSTLFGKSIHEAILTNDIDRVTELLGFYPNIINFEDSNGFKAIHLVAKELPDTKPSWKILQLLLAANVNLKSPTAEGYLPLHLACIHGNIWFLEFLLKNKFESIDLDICDKEGLTALELARQNNQEEAIKILEEFQKNSTLLSKTSEPQDSIQTNNISNSSFVFHQTIREASEESEVNSHIHQNSDHTKEMKPNEESKERIINDEYHSIPNEKILPVEYQNKDTSNDEEILLVSALSQSSEPSTIDENKEDFRESTRETEFPVIEEQQEPSTSSQRSDYEDSKKTSEHQQRRESTSSSLSTSSLSRSDTRSNNETEEDEIKPKEITEENDEDLKDSVPISKPNASERSSNSPNHGKNSKQYEKQSAEPDNQEPERSSSSVSSSSASTVRKGDEGMDNRNEDRNNVDEQVPISKTNGSRKLSDSSKHGKNSKQYEEQSSGPDNQEPERSSSSSLSSSSSASTVRKGNEGMDNGDVDRNVAEGQIPKLEINTPRESGVLPKENNQNQEQDLPQEQSPEYQQQESERSLSPSSSSSTATIRSRDRYIDNEKEDGKTQQNVNQDQSTNMPEDKQEDNQQNNDLNKSNLDQNATQEQDTEEVSGDDDESLTSNSISTASSSTHESQRDKTNPSTIRKRPRISFKTRNDAERSSEKAAKHDAIES